jgi:NADPH:quinone reductase-like Zn-dependent oxidoreductase
MRAMRNNTWAGPLALEHLPIPQPGSGQILVKVHASSVNPIDWKLAGGEMKMMAAVPCTPGFDVAGEITAVGSNVTRPDLVVGQKVFGMLHCWKKQGGSAEYAVMKQDEAVPMPAGMSYQDAAALPLAGMTALQALKEKCELPLRGGAGKRVLVVGASGGVGHLAVQIAKSSGAHVTGVCSTRNVDFVKGLGADEVIDYTRPDAFAGVAPFDIVCDCFGADYGKYMPFMNPRGSIYNSVQPGAGVAFRALANPLTSKKIRWMMLSPSNALLE